jgi:hypothetical protein
MTPSPPDAVVTDHTFKLDTDIERASASGSVHSDPYQFRDGVLDDTTLSQLSRRKKGKRIAVYQRKQNDVSRPFLPCCPCSPFFQLISALLKPMEEHTEEAQSEEEAARLPVMLCVIAHSSI